MAAALSAAYDPAQLEAYLKESFTCNEATLQTKPDEAGAFVLECAMHVAEIKETIDEHLVLNVDNANLRMNEGITKINITNITKAGVEALLKGIKDMHGRLEAKIDVSD